MGEANHATAGCAFAADDDAVATLRALTDAGIVAVWRVGATDNDRAARIARATGATADLDPADPLRGVPGVASGGDAASGVNVGALIGGVVGGAAGAIGGATALGVIMPVDPGMRVAASTLLFFAVGAAVGGVLGGALGEQSSTHAGFRLIDAMEAGDVAAVGPIAPGRRDDARSLLEKSGAAEVVIVG